MEHHILETVSQDILLLIFQSLPNHATLNSLARTNKIFYNLWKQNQYSICSHIAKNHFGTLFPDVYRLLLFQSKLKRESEIEWDIRKLFIPTEIAMEELPGIGILSGGAKIGIAEYAQLLKNKKKAIRARGLVGDEVDIVIQTTQGRVAVTHVYTPAGIIRNDRAVYRFWLLKLVCGADMFGPRAALAYLRFCRKKIQLKQSPEEAAAQYQNAESNVLPFLQYGLNDLKDIFLVSECSRSTELSGEMKEGGHYSRTWLQAQDNQLVHIQVVHHLLNQIVEVGRLSSEGVYGNLRHIRGTR